MRVLFLSGVALLLATAPSARATAPDLQLHSDRGRTVELNRAPGEPVDVAFPDLYVVAAGQPLELEATRAARTHWKIRIDQRLPGRHGPTWHRTRLRAASFPDGIADFVSARIETASGRTVARLSGPFCPNTGQVPIDPLGPGVRRRSRFPLSCGHPFAQRVPWGIERGWASAAAQSLGTLNLPDGTYVAEVAIDPHHALAEARRTNDHLRLRLRVTSQAVGPGPTASASRRRAGVLAPDLFAMPASGITTQTEHGRDEVAFNSMVGNAGPGPLVLQGRRRPPGPKPARQLVRRVGGGWVSRPAGQFVYDPEDGHFHWHYNRLARYRLLDARGRPVRTSGKIGFCFIPTDVIDLPLGAPVPGPDDTQLADCGNSFSWSVKMTLPAGFGDEYNQSVSGQALDVTSLPNRRYGLEVTIDPPHRLLQRTFANDRSVRVIVLGGSRGARTVRVLPWHGISDPPDDPTVLPPTLPPA
jgi:hypothetical protein